MRLKISCCALSNMSRVHGASPPNMVWTTLSAGCMYDPPSTVAVSTFSVVLPTLTINGLWGRMNVLKMSSASPRNALLFARANHTVPPSERFRDSSSHRCFVPWFPRNVSTLCQNKRLSGLCSFSQNT